MRQRLGKKAIKRLQEKYPNLEIEFVLVRGGTDHRRDLCVKGGKIIRLFKDGTLEEDKTCTW